MYQSTRNSEIRRKDTLAVIDGIAPDGGLYFLPDLETCSFDWKDAVLKEECEISAKILSLFLPSFSYEEMLELVKRAYKGKFDGDVIAPMVKVGDYYAVELFHGPTAAFKDVALSVLPHILTSALKKEGINDEVMILTATSGDTGKAALEGFRDVKGTKITVFFPENGVSAIQKKQMVSQEGENVTVVGIRGNFDDAQTGIKNIFKTESETGFLNGTNIRFSSANSINIARLCPQVMYYFKAYGELVKLGRITLGEKINFSVPTGNFGNILAGVIAKKLGLPVNKFICASNSNNVLTDFINTGIYDKNREFIKTCSPSMDILVSSNLERLLFLLSGSDKEVKGYMQSLSECGKYEVSDKIKTQVKEIFSAYYLDDEESFEVIKSNYEKNGYLADTHTAVAFGAADKYRKDTKDLTETVIISTASPYKFASSVSKAIGVISGKDEFETMRNLSEYTGTQIPKPLSNLETKEVLHKNVCDKDKMLEFVKERIGVK